MGDCPRYVTQKLFEVATNMPRLHIPCAYHNVYCECGYSDHRPLLASVPEKRLGHVLDLCRDGNLCDIYSCVVEGECTSLCPASQALPRLDRFPPHSTEQPARPAIQDCSSKFSSHCQSPCYVVCSVPGVRHRAHTNLWPHPIRSQRNRQYQFPNGTQSAHLLIYDEWR